MSTSPADRDARLDALLKQAQAGSAEAAQALVEEHRHQLLTVVRRHLAKRARVVVDSNDVMQDVGLAVLAHALPTDVYRSRAAVLAYLSKMAENAARTANQRHLFADKRSLLRQEAIDEVNEREEIIDRLNTVVDCEFQDAWQNFLRTLPPVYCRVACLLSDGNAGLEIADMVGISLRTTTRIISRLKVRCASWLHSEFESHAPTLAGSDW